MANNDFDVGVNFRNTPLSKTINDVLTVLNFGNDPSGVVGKKSLRQAFYAGLPARAPSPPRTGSTGPSNISIDNAFDVGIGGLTSKAPAPAAPAGVSRSFAAGPTVSAPTGGQPRRTRSAPQARPAGVVKQNKLGSPGQEQSPAGPTQLTEQTPPLAPQGVAEALPQGQLGGEQADMKGFIPRQEIGPRVDVPGAGAAPTGGLRVINGAEAPVSIEEARARGIADLNNAKLGAYKEALDSGLPEANARAAAAAVKSVPEPEVIQGGIITQSPVWTTPEQRIAGINSQIAAGHGTPTQVAYAEKALEGAKGIADIGKSSAEARKIVEEIPWISKEKAADVQKTLSEVTKNLAEAAHSRASAANVGRETSQKGKITDKDIMETALKMMEQNETDENGNVKKGHKGTFEDLMSTLKKMGVKDVQKYKSTIDLNEEMAKAAAIIKAHPSFAPQSKEALRKMGATDAQMKAAGF